MKRKREKEEEEENKNNGMEIVWQTPANPPQKHDYIFRDGRRHVRPYYFEFISHVKNRWAGKTIVDLFAEEFKGRPYDYYVSAVKCGRIQVDGETVPVSYIVKPSQKISHFLHRHEPPVNAFDVSVLQQDPDVVTVCKPATVPVHPCGQYRKNTVVGILQAEHDVAPIFPVHRLDRLVSGLLIFARNASKAEFFRQEIEAGKVQKQYVAKVIGTFPENEQVVDVNINYNAREGRSTAVVGDSCGNSPAKGKVACTKFTRISTNGTHSIVLCKPITGRTHQIRVHLQYTGHPIANDFLYLSEYVPSRTFEGMSAERAARCSSSVTSLNCCAHKDDENLVEGFSIDPMCTNCPDLAPKGAIGVHTLELQSFSADTRCMKRVYGYIACNILELDGFMNAHILNGHFLASHPFLCFLFNYFLIALLMRKKNLIEPSKYCQTCIIIFHFVTEHIFVTSTAPDNEDYM